ncbi:MAG TPA: hypothetical protein VD994_18145 [Prosthecobacter sp.]|nr:hypothetical protein [Prosthecobacter sp.]
MKTQSFKPLLIVAACAATAVPLAAAPGDDTRSVSSSSNSNTEARSSQSDRRIDFGKPVRFVRNTFSRDDDRDSKSLNQPQREEGKTQFWNRDDDKDRSWGRDDRRNDQTMKKEEKKDGFFSRMLSWRPFKRDGDR